VHGEAFEALYERYEDEKRFTRQVRAEALMGKMVTTMLERGKPYFLFKDHVNRKSNHMHLGTVRSSNLCCEIVQYTSPDEVAVCNLGVVNLGRFVLPLDYDTVDDVDAQAFFSKYVDYQGIREATAQLVRNLNRSIDTTFYPLDAARKSNLLHRPLGIGITGLCELFMLLKLPYESEHARLVNRMVAEHMYQAAIEESCKLAARDGVYASYEGSPTSKGLFQMDLWKVAPVLDWTATRAMVKQHGLRNSLLIALMPTATGSQSLCSFTECIEPPFALVFKRLTLSGEHLCVWCVISIPHELMRETAPRWLTR
jgi:ribonucleotide reductase alpha subunit